MLMMVALFFVGLCIGSFLNVCIFRLPRDKSLIRPASFCPHCNTPIKWFDNIPLLGYLFLGGRCRQCKEKISLRYPFVELITGLLFVLLYRELGLGIVFYKFLFFFCLLIVVSFIDIDYHAIPGYLCFIGLIVGFLFSLGETIRYMRTETWQLGMLPIVTVFQASVFGFGFVYLFKFLGDVFITVYLHVIKKESIEGEKESLGLGDVDFMGMLGAFLGIKAVVLVFFIAPFLASGYFLLTCMFKKTHLLPYLPYLSLASLITFLWGDKILRLVLGI